MQGRSGAVGGVAAALLLAAVPAAGAATITVNTRADKVSPTDGTCSLREAIAASNSGTPSGGVAGECPAGDPIAGTIVLPGGAPYVLTAAGGGALHITSAVTIAGGGAASTTIDGGGIDRVFDIGSTVVSIKGVTITGAHAPNGIYGTPSGGSGGGIRNVGVLTLTDVQVVNNRAGDADQSLPANTIPGAPGGSGGGIYNGGTATLIRTTVAKNEAGAGGPGGFHSPPTAAGAGGLGGSGGGVANATGATLNIVDSSIANNHAGAGGTGGDTGTGGVNAAVGGDGGAGGGVWNAGTISLTGSALTGNSAGPGGKGGFNRMIGSTSGGGPGGRGGLGGGIYDTSAVSQTIVNSTISANFAGTGGDGILGGYGGDGGSGGGAVSADAPLRLINVTVSGNQVGSGGGDGGGGPGGSGSGGGINAFGSATIQNTIVAGNSGGNCVGAITDAGDNLSFPDTTCPGINGDPKLGPLQNNGGSTPTSALAAGSAAVDQIPATGAGCPATDQRGVSRPRPAGGKCDIGAYEFAPPACSRVTITTGAGAPVLIHLSCADPAGLAVTYVLDATPAHGTLGALIADGTIRYTPKAGYTGPDEFTYHATSANGTASTEAVSITVNGHASPPQITHARLTAKRFRVASQNTVTAANKAPFGTSFRFTLTAAANLQIKIIRSVSGLRRGRSCVAPTAMLRRAHAKPCSRTLQVATLIRAQEPLGADSVAFSGRVGHRALRPGRYTATLAASNAGGRSKRVPLAFVVVR